MLKQYVYDHDGNIIRVGDRVKIICDRDPSVYNKIGVVTLIDTSLDSRDNPTRRNKLIGQLFVEMLDSGGGRWWHWNFVRAHPKR